MDSTIGDVPDAVRCLDFAACLIAEASTLRWLFDANAKCLTGWAHRPPGRFHESDLEVAFLVEMREVERDVPSLESPDVVRGA